MEIGWFGLFLLASIFTSFGVLVGSMCRGASKADDDARWISTGYALVDHKRGSIIVLQEREYYRLFNLIRPSVIGDDSNG